jgi:hypothetical protein
MTRTFTLAIVQVLSPRFGVAQSLSSLQAEWFDGVERSHRKAMSNSGGSILEIPRRT